MGPKLRRRLPEPTHPAWKLAQQALTIGAVLLVVFHLGGEGLEHPKSVDAGDVAGGALIVKELLYWLKRGASR